MSAKQQAEFATRAAQHDQASADLDDDDPPPPAVDDDLPTNTPPKYRDGTPKPKAQRNFTDPDSRLMVQDGAFMQAYNGQIAVDEANQIIVAAALSNQGVDAQYFVPMLRRVVENCGAVPARGTGGAHRRDGFPDEESNPVNTRTDTARAIRDLLNTEEGHAIYARRKATVEPVFGQIKACRGIRAMSFRGLFKNRCEWLFVCATHNLLKLWRALRSTPRAMAAIA